MLNIDEHISELLYDHDCVIVPALGGFLASNVQAKLNPAQHTISPPRRKIAFNIYLRQNDGLLANHLVEYDRVSYPEAISRIEAYVQDCFSKLDLHRKIIIERVGTVYYDKEKHLLFEPFRQAQFRKDAYGLGPLQILPLEKQDAGSRMEQQRKEIFKSRPSLKSTTGFFSGKKVNYKILGAFAIAGTMIWFSFNIFLFQPKDGYLSSLNPFALDTSIPVATQVIEKEKEKEQVLPTPVEVKQNIETVFVASTAPVIVPEEIEVPEIVHTTPDKSVATPAASGNYHVIAGAFKIAGNAEAFVSTLKSQGFHSTHIIRSGILSYVSYNSFEDRASATELLDSLRKQNVEGWIWHN